jgi:hypothetical protein
VALHEKFDVVHFFLNRISSSSIRSIWSAACKWNGLMGMLRARVLIMPMVTRTDLSDTCAVIVVFNGLGHFSFLSVGC